MVNVNTYFVSNEMDVADATVGTSSSKGIAPALVSDSHHLCTGYLYSDQRPKQNSPEITEKENIQRRLKTFVNWIEQALPIQLSIAGFIFIGPGDKVQCETCKVKLYNWKKDMVPLEEHRENSPNCGFLKKWFPSKSVSTATSTEESGFNASKAKYQERLDVTKRISTFEAWPLKFDIHSPVNMALAGFFYIGSADRARCFYCGMTLRDWDTDDDPFDAHLQWSPKCEYINHVHKNKINKENKQTTTPAKKEESRPVLSIASTSQGPAAGITVVGGSDNSSRRNSPAISDSTSSKWKYSTQFEAVMDMGFQPELIQMVTDQRISRTGDGFPDVTSLYMAVEELAQ